MFPTSLSALKPLAHNLWWSWDTEASALWQTIDPWRWERCRHNPAALLQDVEDERWSELCSDDAFMTLFRSVSARFDHYMAGSGWCKEAAPQVHQKHIAYFSMEFGLHESLRIYSGGLGVLAGDHIRSASDLDVPLVGISFLYKHGYFRQIIDGDRQEHCYPSADFERLPVELCTKPDGSPIFISFPIEDRTPIAKIWKLAIGRTTLYLLDTDHDLNSEADRMITHHLYGGDQLMRITQEVALGVGGVRALRALNLPVDLYHLNEGHCAFIGLELLREKREQGLNESKATQWVKSHCVFTTHTPVPAGHDRFHWNEVNRVLGPWRDAQGLAPGAFMDLGRIRPGDPHETLCMTVLALNLSAKANGVSKLHGAVSREMWQELWPNTPVEAIPIEHVTNGVHPTFWMSVEARALFDKHLEGWRENPWDPEVWAGVDAIPAEELWSMRCAVRARLIDLVKDSSGAQLDPNALTIGFARRFAPYKRGNLLFSQPERLKKLLDQGVQIIFAGKAHPKDEAGKEIIAEVIRWSNTYPFRNQVAFIDDYDITIGRMMTSGADVWLNNPRRPKEASGTSGQKVPLNGGINLSCLDGWWPEAFDGSNGWGIGTTGEHESVEAHDLFDAESLFSLLEEQVVPLWSKRNASDIPEEWVQYMRNSIKTCAPMFTSHRMVRDYVLNVYGPQLRA